MTDPTYIALRTYHRTVTGLIGDPDVTGDLLLVGMWLARAVHLNQPAPGDGGWDGAQAAQDLFGGDPYPQHRYRDALKADVPRYDPWVDNGGRHTRIGRECVAPMVRRDGSCGQPTSRQGWWTDVTTGRQIWHGACNRHKVWFEQTWRANRAEVTALGGHLPKPAANTGGALARHITRVRWVALWPKLDASWNPYGIDGMTLVDLIEMLADWKAATERHADGDLAHSLEIQRERFGISDQGENLAEGRRPFVGYPTYLTSEETT